MVVTIEMIPLVSNYTVGTTGDFTKVAFDWYKKLAEADFAIDDPGLSAEKADEAVANLICDIFASRGGDRELKSEKIGDYSYTKNDSGKTSYRIKYEEIIKQYATQPATNGVTRIDSTLPKQFNFDNQPVRAFGDE
jgi:hypothetical protein